MHHEKDSEEKNWLYNHITPPYNKTICIFGDILYSQLLALLIEIEQKYNLGNIQLENCIFCRFLSTPSAPSPRWGGLFKENTVNRALTTISNHSYKLLWFDKLHARIKKHRQYFTKMCRKCLRVRRTVGYWWTYMQLRTMLCKQACNDNEVSIYAYTNISYEKHYSSLSIMYWHNIMVFCKVIHIYVSKRLSGFDIKKVGNGVPRGGLGKNGFGL